MTSSLDKFYVFVNTRIGLLRFQQIELRLRRNWQLDLSIKQEIYSLGVHYVDRFLKRISFCKVCGLRVVKQARKCRSESQVVYLSLTLPRKLVSCIESPRNGKLWSFAMNNSDFVWAAKMVVLRRTASEMKGLIKLLERDLNLHEGITLEIKVGKFLVRDYKKSRLRS